MSKSREASIGKMHIVDAIDHLSNMAELDSATSKEELIAQGLKAQLRSLKELTPSARERVLALIKTTFRTIHHYLKHIYHKDEVELKDIEMQQGIQAMMKLAVEAAEKLKSCTSLFRYTYKEGKFTEIKEYQQLATFYFDSVLKRFQEVVAVEEVWESQWEGEDLYLNIERVGLKDLDTVKRDQQYELFSIRQEDGSSFFNRNLLRHIKLITDFDQLVSDLEGEDPLLMVHLLGSKQAQVVADSIKTEIKDLFDTFCVGAKKHRKLPLVAKIKKLVIPLILAANKKNVLTEAEGKSCGLYLSDYHRFLRALLMSEDYQRLIEHSFAEVDTFGQEMIELVDKLCFAFFTPLVDRAEWVNYLCQLISRGLREVPQKKQKALAPKSFLQDVFNAYESIDQLLKNYPNGPLFKAMDLFRERAEIAGFDPLLQGNPAYQLYTLTGKSLTAICLSLPCPTQHQKIHDAIVVEEFKGYLRFLSRREKPQIHLLINLQDPTSWQEHSRCQVLHQLVDEPEKQPGLAVITLPKRGDFYYQTDAYAELDEAAAFLQTITDQIEGEKSCGFGFSGQIKKKDVLAFCRKGLPIIHEVFFDGEEKLSRQKRLDFIEIFYLLLAFKAIDLTRPAYFSFSCKDAVDVGAMSSAGFFALTLLLKGEKKWSVANQNTFFYLVFCPALMVRERLIDSRRFYRAMSALSVLAQAIEKKKEAVVESLTPLYRASFLATLDIE
ncbi:MAG: hypothetical protein AAF443_02910 [Chlamydiota bacterium]